MKSLYTRRPAGLKVLAFAAALTLPVLGAASFAHAQDDDDSMSSPQYDGYCYENMADANLDAAIAHGDRVNRSGNHSKCYRGQYFSYRSNYYQPPAPPRGFVTVLYEDRPDPAHFTRVNYDRDPRTMPPPAGTTSWRDDRGYWHEGLAPRHRFHHHDYYDSIVSGWRDANGNWHTATHYTR